MLLYKTLSFQKAFYWANLIFIVNEILAIYTGFELAAVCRFRVFVPLLIASHVTILGLCQASGSESSSRASKFAAGYLSPAICF
jgi:hypothetical protein